MNNYNGYYDWYQNYNFYGSMRNSLPQESLLVLKKDLKKAICFLISIVNIKTINQ